MSKKKPEELCEFTQKVGTRTFKFSTLMCAKWRREEWLDDLKVVLKNTESILMLEKTGLEYTDILDASIHANDYRCVVLIENRYQALQLNSKRLETKGASKAWATLALSVLENAQVQDLTKAEEFFVTQAGKVGGCVIREERYPEWQDVAVKKKSLLKTMLDW